MTVLIVYIKLHNKQTDRILNLIQELHLKIEQIHIDNKIH